MAIEDLTPEQQEMATLIAKANEEMRRFGSVSRETSDAIAAGGSRSLKLLTTAGEASVAALGSLTAGLSSSVKAIGSGQLGLKAFDGMVDGIAGAAGEASKSFMAMGGPLGIVTASVLKFVELLAGPAKAVMEMVDKYNQSYQTLAKAGAVGADGLAGVGRDALSMGLVLKDMDRYVGIISASAPDLALLGGSAGEGRTMLAEMGKEVEKDRANFFAMGYDMGDVAEGMTGFIKQQNLSGGVTSRNSKDMARAAQQYILDNDALTKLTGVSRKEMESQYESAMREEQFSALIAKTRMEQGDAAANAIIQTRKMIEGVGGPEMAKGFAASLTGNLQDPVAQKFARTVGMERVNQLQQLRTGMMAPIDALGLVAEGSRKFADTVGVNLALIGANNQSYMAMNELAKMSAADKNQAMLRKSFEDNQHWTVDAANQVSKETGDYAKLQAKQLAAAIKIQEEMMKMSEPLLEAGNKLMDVILNLVDGLTTLVNWFFKKPTPAPPTPSTAEAKVVAEDLTKEAADLKIKIDNNDASDKDKLKYKKLSAQAAQAGNQTIASRENEKRLISLKKRELAQKGIDLDYASVREMVKQELYEQAELEADKKIQQQKSKVPAPAAPAPPATEAPAPAAPAPAANTAPVASATETPAPAAPSAPAVPKEAAAAGAPAAPQVAAPTPTTPPKSSAATTTPEPKMALGGITRGPSIVGEAGPEAVIPLKSGRVPVDLGAIGDILRDLKPVVTEPERPAESTGITSQYLQKTIENLATQLAQPKPVQMEMLEILREIRRVDDETASLSAKIARAAMN